MAFAAATPLTPYAPVPYPRQTLRRTIRCSSAAPPSPSPMILTNQFDLRTYWTTLIREINQKLDEAIPIRYPERIYEAMRYSALAKGAKRAPPVMCIAACELFGGDRLGAFPTACALEMVHAASLIHDDLPCMDDDPSRRGQPSNHTIYGVDMAILAGDALFPLGFRHIVSQTPRHLVPDARLLRVIAEIARTVGSTGMAAGQLLDLEAPPPEGATFELVQEKKFGEMGECSAACGAILAGASEHDVGRLRRYGRAVGVLYEVVDDVLEAKKQGGGERNNGKSYAQVYGVEKAMEVAEDLRAKAKQELVGLHVYDGDDDRVAPLYSFVDYAVDRGFSVGD